MHVWPSRRRTATETTAASLCSWWMVNQRLFGSEKQSWYHIVFLPTSQSLKHSTLRHIWSLWCVSGYQYQTTTFSFEASTFYPVGIIQIIFLPKIFHFILTTDIHCLCSASNCSPVFILVIKVLPVWNIPEIYQLHRDDKILLTFLYHSAIRFATSAPYKTHHCTLY